MTITKILNRSLVVLTTSTLLASCNHSPEAVQHNVAGAQAPDIYTDYLHRDIRDDIFYFLMLDRFDNGDPANDQGSKTLALSRGGFDPTSKAYYHGGDMAGLESRLDYLEGLGITAIWLNPILRNKAVDGDSSGYHGYWILDFTEIDPHFGSNDELKSLIDAAHERGMKVFFDIITNHTANVIRYRECQESDGTYLDSEADECPYKSKAQLAAGNSYTPYIPEGEEDAKVPAWLNDPEHYNNQGDSFWEGESALYGDFAGLDDLNTLSPEVLEGFIHIYKDIITEFKPDGFRIDTVKHVDMSFWQTFAPAIQAHAAAEGIPNFYQFGEVYSFDPALLSTYTTAGKLPAILDFAFQGAVADVVARGEGPSTLVRLHQDDDYYSDADSDASLLLNFIGNHDMGRLGYFLNTELPEASNDEKLQRSRLGHALMYFSRGVPVIYYGDEQGFTGDGNDQAARENMMPSQVDSYNDNELLGTDATTAEDNFDPEHPLYQTLAGFGDIYKAHPTLRRGIQYPRLADDEASTYAFSRIDPETGIEYLLLFNLATQKRALNLQATAQSYTAIVGSEEVLTAADGELSLQLPPLNFAIYRTDTPVTAVTDLNVELAAAGVDPRAEEIIWVEYDIAASIMPLPLLRLTTEVRDASGQYQLVGHDNAPPFRARVDKNLLQPGVATDIRVTVDNYRGQRASREFELPSQF